MAGGKLVVYLNVDHGNKRMLSSVLTNEPLEASQESHVSQVADTNKDLEV